VNGPPTPTKTVKTPVGLALVGADRMSVTHIEALRAAPGAAAFADLNAALDAGGIEAVPIAARRRST
jgi:hypothetical protein